MTAAAVLGGFAAPAFDAARAFRAALSAMARPGVVVTVAGAAPPAPLSPAAGALILTLADADTPVWLAAPLARDEIRDWIAFHAGAPLAGSRGAAALAVGRWADLAPLADFACGTAERPDRSATLIVECDTLVARGARLTGPGIRGASALSLAEAAPGLAAARAALPPFPLGIDFFLAAGDRAAALPRSVRIAEAACT